MGENIAFGYLQFWHIWHFYRPQRSCGKVIFSQACVKNSVGGGSVCLSACWDTPPWADTPLGQTHPLGRHHPQADTTPSQCMLGYTPVHAGIHTPPCPVHAGIDMATAADGMHPTGMHSCCLAIYVRFSFAHVTYYFVIIIINSKVR